MESTAHEPPPVPPNVQARERILRQRGCVVWLTGLPGSGKSTVAEAVERRLIEQGHIAFVLDGDRIREGLNRDLRFTPEDRAENIRRVGEVAALFAEAGLIVLVAFISPYRRERDMARERVRTGHFFEVFLDVPVEVCERRDPKGMYRRAQEGALRDFTGVSAPYESPLRPELILDTDTLRPDQCADAVLALLSSHAMLSPPVEGS